MTLHVGRFNPTVMVTGEVRLDMDGFDPDRCELRATATRWVAGGPQLGMVEVQFSDHNGHVVTIREKSAVIGGELLPTTPCPVEVRLLCEIIAVSTPAYAVRLVHVEDITGRRDFTVSWEIVETERSRNRRRR